MVIIFLIIIGSLTFRRDNMLFTRKPYQIDSVYFVENTLKIGCQCKEYAEALTGGRGSFEESKGRITISASAAMPVLLA